jgi:hypothetical protein
MLKWGYIGAAHWFVMVSFMILVLLVVEAYFEVVDPAGRAADHRGLDAVRAWSPSGSASWAWPGSST